MEVHVVVEALRWLSEQKTPLGTWGKRDTLDELISTTHVAMTMMAAGIPANSEILRSGFQFLRTIDMERQIHFFWRAGVFLNVKDHQDLVAHDARYIWKNLRRIGVHRDYPVPFFLLKLLSFSTDDLGLQFSKGDVVKWILDEWANDGECWYGRPSITSMAMALLLEHRFKNRAAIINQSVGFLENCFLRSGSAENFSSNLVENAFVIFNLCENGALSHPECTPLALYVKRAVQRMVMTRETDKPYWSSPPPFGGEIGPLVYPTAVMARALIAYHALQSESYFEKLALCLSSAALAQLIDARNKRVATRSLWGEVAHDPTVEKRVFVLMPFTEELSDIYRSVVKPELERLKLTPRRADDFYSSRAIMTDIWREICISDIVIAELTQRNPNVMYELGMAHVLGKKVILIAQSLNDVPFDLRSLRVLIYNTSPSGYKRLRAGIRLAIKEELGVV